MAKRSVVIPGIDNIMARGNDKKGINSQAAKRIP
jgi:hypothetical protein